MRRLTAVLIVAAWSAWASPACLVGTLSSYLALGPGGCSFQSDAVVTLTAPIAFSSFLYSGDPSNMTVLPDLNPSAPGFELTGFRTAPGSSLDATLTFEIDAPAEQVGFFMQGWNGSINAVESVCIGSPFSPDGTCSTGQLQSVPVNGAAAMFPTAAILGISDHFQLGSDTSVAFFGVDISRSAPYGFCDCASAGGAVAPEVGSGWLLAAGLIVFGVISRRK